MYKLVQESLVLITCAQNKEEERIRINTIKLHTGLETLYVKVTKHRKTSHLRGPRGQLITQLHGIDMHNEVIHEK